MYEIIDAVFSSLPVIWEATNNILRSLAEFVVNLFIVVGGGILFYLVLCDSGGRTKIIWKARLERRIHTIVKKIRRYGR